MKYGDEKFFEVSKDEELVTKVEFAKQRQFLEQSIFSLKKRVNMCIKKNDSYNKIMEDNMVLIKEITKLRHELKMSHKKYDITELNFKMKRNKNIISKQTNNNSQKLETSLAAVE